MKTLIEKYSYKHLAKTINSHHDDQSQVLFGYQMRQLKQPHRRRASMHSFITVFGIMSVMLMSLPLCCIDAVGFSYTRFVGPVADPERKVFVNHANPNNDGAPAHFDYVGKPEYDFAYGVEDADAHILHNRNEVRDGDTVKGVYSLIDPDGTLRVVKYTADEINGFRAEVTRNGVTSPHDQSQHDYIGEPPPPPKTVIYNHDDVPIYEQHHYPHSHKHLKDDRYAYHQSSNAYEYRPKLEPLPPKMHETPPHHHIIYQYKKKYADEADDDNESNNESDSDYHEDQQPHYEVHERPDCDEEPESQDQPPQYKVHEKPESHGHEPYAESVNAFKSNIRLKAANYKKKKHHHEDDNDDDDEDDDDDDYYRWDDSEELEDFDEAFHSTRNSEESDEYY